MVQHDVGRAKLIGFSFFLFLGCSRHLRWILQSVTYMSINWHMPKLVHSFLYVYYSNQLGLYIQFLHGSTANNAHDTNGDQSKGPLMSKAGLGIPISPKKGRITDLDGRQELGFHEGPSRACERFEPWESNYRFWDLSPGKPEPGIK